MITMHFALNLVQGLNPVFGGQQFQSVASPLPLEGTWANCSPNAVVGIKSCCSGINCAGTIPAETFV